MNRNVILVSMKNEGLALLAQELNRNYQIRTAYFEADLTNMSELEKLVKWINYNYSIDLLINNAGIGVTAAFEQCSTNYLNRIIQLNIASLSIITRELLPNLLNNSYRSYVLNVSSMAAFCPIGFKSVYPASKRFIYHFSSGLHHELKGTNVRVATVFPGPMRTNKEVCQRIKNQGFAGRLSIQNPNSVAESSLKKLFKGHSFILIGFLNKINYLIISLLPSWILASILTRAFKKELELNNKTHEFGI